MAKKQSVYDQIMGMLQSESSGGSSDASSGYSQKKQSVYDQVMAQLTGSTGGQNRVDLYEQAQPAYQQAKDRLQSLAMDRARNDALTQWGQTEEAKAYMDQQKWDAENPVLSWAQGVRDTLHQGGAGMAVDAASGSIDMGTPKEKQTGIMPGSYTGKDAVEQLRNWWNNKDTDNRTLWEKLQDAAVNAGSGNGQEAGSKLYEEPKQEAIDPRAAYEASYEKELRKARANNNMANALNEQFADANAAGEQYAKLEEEMNRLLDEFQTETDLRRIGQIQDRVDELDAQMQSMRDANGGKAPIVDEYPVLEKVELPEKVQGRILPSIFRDIDNSAASKEQQDYTYKYVLLDEGFQTDLTMDELNNLQEYAKSELEKVKMQYNAEKAEASGMMVEGPGPLMDAWQEAEAKANETKNRMEMLQAGVAQMDKSRNLVERNEQVRDAEQKAAANSDFEDVARVGASKAGLTFGQIQGMHAQGKTVPDDAIHNKVEWYFRNVQAWKDTADKGADAIANMGTEADVISDMEARNVRLMTDTERKTYTYKLETEGEEAADAYLDLLSVTLDKRNSDESSQFVYDAYKNAREGVNGFIDRAIMQGASIVNGTYGGAQKALGSLASMATGEYNPYKYSTMSNQSAAVDNAQAEMIDEAIHEKLGNGWFADLMSGAASYGYRGLKQGVQSALGMATAGQFGGWFNSEGLPVGVKHLVDSLNNGYTVLMSAGAWADKYQELDEKGYGDGAKNFVALGVGLANGLFEELSLETFAEEFLNNPVKGKMMDRVKQYIKKAFVMGGVESSEELATDMAELTIDAIVNGAGREYQADINERSLQGQTWESAKWSKLKDQIMDEVVTAYTSLVSGMAMAPSGAIANEAAYSQEQRTIGSNIDSVSGGAESLNTAGQQVGVKPGLFQIALEKANAALQNAQSQEGTKKGFFSGLQTKVADAVSGAYQRALGAMSQQVQQAQIEQAEAAQREAFREAARNEIRAQNEIGNDMQHDEGTDVQADTDPGEKKKLEPANADGNDMQHDEGTDVQADTDPGEKKKMEPATADGFDMQHDEGEIAEVLTKAKFEGEEALNPDEREIYEAAGGEETVNKIWNSQEFIDSAKSAVQSLADSFMEQLANAQGNTQSRWSTESINKEKETVAEWAQQYAEPEKVQNVWKRRQNAIQFTSAFEAAYEMGQQGISEEYALKAGSTQYLDQEQIRAAYEMGRKDAGYEAETEGGTVRQSQQWNDSESASGQVRAVETGRASTEGRTENGYEAAGEGTGSTVQVSAKEIGIQEGTDKKKLVVIQEQKYNADEREAAKVARDNGLRLVVVKGGSIDTMSRIDGKPFVVKARGAIIGGTMYVRSDHNQFTAAQIARHEAAHNQIERGEISRETVKAELKKKYTEAQINEIIHMYAVAYGNSGMTAEEIFEEILCDSMGRMNAFATEGFETVAGDVGRFLRDTRKAALDTKTEAKEDAQGKGAEKSDIKNSREMESMEELKKQNYMLRRQVEHWKQQSKVSQNPEAYRKDTNMVADELLRDYASKSSKFEMRELIKHIADDIIGGRLEYDYLKKRCKDAAELVLQGTFEADPGAVEVWHQLKSYFAGKTIRMPDGAIEVGGKEDFRELAKDVRRKYGFRLSENTGIKLDEIWYELQEYFGTYLFPDEAYGGNDAVWHLLQTMDNMVPQEVSEFERNWSGTVEQISNDLLARLLSEDVRQSKGTAADRLLKKTREDAFAQGVRFANEEWQEYSEMLIQAETEELRERQYRREYEMEQEHLKEMQQQRDTMIQRQEARETAERARLEESIARNRETEKKKMLEAQNRETKDKIWKLAEKFDSIRKNRNSNETRHVSPALIGAVLDFCQTFNDNRIEKNEKARKSLEDRAALMRTYFVADLGLSERGYEKAIEIQKKIAAARRASENYQERLQRLDDRKGMQATIETDAEERAKLEKLMESYRVDMITWQEELNSMFKDISERKGVVIEELQKMLEEALKVQRLQNRNEGAREKYKKLRDEYAKLQEDAVEYDPVVAQMVKDIGARIEAMDELQKGSWTEDRLKAEGKNLTEIYNTMRSLLHTIIDSNQAFSMGQGKQIREMAEKMRKEMAQVNYAAPGWKSTLQRYAMWQMSPDTFFSYLCGFAKNNEGSVIQHGFAMGTQRMLETEREYFEIFREITESKDKNIQKELQKLLNPDKKSYVKWGLVDKTGAEVETSRGMMLQAYMMLMQEDSRKSLVFNGFRIPNSEIYYKGRTKEAYGNQEDMKLTSVAMDEEYRELVQRRNELSKQLETIDKDDIDARDEIFEELKKIKKQEEPLIEQRNEQLQEMALRIEEQLTDTEKHLIELAHKWYSRSGQMMRGVFLDMYGYAPKLVENYVPIHRDPDTLVLDIRTADDASKALNLENLGFTKERVQSTKPILLTDFFVELEQQKKSMGRYVGFARVQRDFSKILNVALEGDTNLKKMIGARFGKGGTRFGVSGEEYINHYIADVAGGHHDESVISDLYGNYAAATLRFNPRVAVSQAASIPTAAAIVGWDNALEGLKNGIGKAGSRKYKDDLASKSAWFYSRYRGQGAATEISDMKNRGGAIEKMANSQLGKKLFNWCQDVDVLSTGSIMWEMAKSYVKRNEGMAEDAEGFDQRVNEVYTDILRRSQPNYTTTERSDLLRDKRGGMKMLTMFKTQSNQNLNILINATLEQRKMAADLKAGINGVTAADLKAANMKVANAYTSVLLGGTAFFVALRTAVNFLMANVKGYRDDETGEVELDDVMASMGQEMLSSIMGMTAMGGQVTDFIMPMITGGKYYGLSDSAISALSDTMTNTQNVLAAAVSQDKKVTMQMLTKAVNSWGLSLGIPVGNANKLAGMIEAYTKDIAGGTFGRYDATADYSKDQMREQITRAVMAGDEKKAANAMTKLWASGTKDTDEENQKQMRSQYATWLQKGYEAAEYTDSEAVKLLMYVGFGKDDAEAKVAKWDFKIEYPDMESNQISDALVSAYNQRGSIDGKVFLEAYEYAKNASADKDAKGNTISGSKKAKIVQYIQKLRLTDKQKKQLYELLNVGSLADTPWA